MLRALAPLVASAVHIPLSQLKTHLLALIGLIEADGPLPPFAGWHMAPQVRFYPPLPHASSS